MCRLGVTLFLCSLYILRLELVIARYFLYYFVVHVLILCQDVTSFYDFMCCLLVALK
jgi:hypothetical protein